MKTEKVLTLSPEDRFWYWCRERHQIFLRKKNGKPKPWTDDKILQSFYFTNPYRENDKVTVWFRENIRDPLRDDPRVIFATICFRWFNRPMTGKYLMGIKPVDKRRKLQFGGLEEWDEDVVELLKAYRDSGNKVFTGAYMINSPAGKPKLEAICERIDNVWQDRENLVRDLTACKTLKDAHERLTVYPGLGGFYAYEIVCDLRYTYVLEDADDIYVWCNPGPGAIRGMCRILEMDIPNPGNNATSPPVPPEWEYETQRLLGVAWRKLKGMPKFEMREVEHSLCEADKYMRLLLGEGRSKRRYNGQAD